MAESCTITEYRVGTVKKIVFDWESAADGSVGVADPTISTTTYAYDGTILALKTDPDAGGDAPSDNYTVTLLDAQSDDVLFGAATTNRDTATTEYIHCAAGTLGFVSTSRLTLVIGAAGAGNKGVATVWIR